MIEKLSEYEITKRDGDYIDADNNTKIINTLVCKINELIDIIEELDGAITATMDSVNIHEKQIDELQMKVEPEKCETPADPYAEQQRWIGKVCRFWYDNPNDTLLDYLDKIQMGRNGVVQYYSKESGDWFSHCEPVKPDDDIIYKGGKDE